MWSSNALVVISVMLWALVPGTIVIGSIVFLIIKIIERQKEKKNEDMDKYDKY